MIERKRVGFPSGLCTAMLLAAMPLLADGGRSNKVGVSEWDNVLAQVADGSGWSTRIMLINMDNVAATFTLSFYKDDGTAWKIALKNSTSGPSSSWSGVIPVGGSLFLETTGAGSSIDQGWAYLSTQRWISGMAVFKAAWLATNDAEAVVPFSSELDVDFFMPFDNRNGYITSLAMVNPWATGTASVSLQFRNPDGTVILSDTIQLEPRHHVAFSTYERYEAVRGKNGVIEFKVPGGQMSASALGLLFSPRNTFTSIHTVSIDPYVFP
jgi:hypothetical protein